MLAFPSALKHLPQGHWPGFGEQVKVNLLLPRQKSTLTFFKIPQILRARFRCMTSFTSPSSIWDFYFDISEWHILPARSWTPALMLHLTNPCAKRKVLNLTKPKGKKSLGHYITERRTWYCIYLFKTLLNDFWRVSYTKIAIPSKSIINKK